MRKDFAIFVISHGRANIMTTVDTLLKHGYTGQWFVVLDDLDDSIDAYKSRFGDGHILVFDKMEYVRKTDTGMSEPLIKFAVFARNAVEDFAKSMGYKYFGLFDDDILRFRHRYIKDSHLLSKPVENIDKILDTYISFLSIDNISCISFGTAVSYAGGLSSYDRWSASTRRMCYQAMLRDVSVDVNWSLNMYEDVTTPLLQGRCGYTWLQLLNVEFDMMPCGRGDVSGGNSDVYKTMHPAEQVFFPIIASPDCNYIVVRNNRFRTKLLQSKYVLPKIISGGYKK